MITRQRLTRLTAFLVIVALAPVLTFRAQQNPERQRRITPEPTASPTPLPTSSVTPIVVPSAAPRQTAIETPVRSGPITRTVGELQTRISEVLKRVDLTPAMVGIKVVSLDTGRVLFEENANKLLRPASNMKLYTVATALDRLSPNYHFTTSVYAESAPDAVGVIHGDLIIYGRGDPSIAARFNNGDYLKGINELAGRIAAAGVKRIEGDLVGDETYFSGPQYGSGWEWEDLQWYYGAEVSSLTINDNALDLFIKPGSQVGSSAVISTGPPDPLLTIWNRVTTGAKGTKRELMVHRGLAADVLEISGSIPLDDKGYVGGVGISHPALLFVYLLRASLAERGVTVTGKSRTISPPISDGPANAAHAPPARVEIANMQSPPLSVVAGQTLKPSQNLYTELILRTLGRVVTLQPPAGNGARTSEDAGIEVVKTFLKEAGLNPDSLVLSDGSGLSRNDMVTAEATLQLLTYMNRHAHANVFRDALPIAGVDGTLRNRMKGTPAENNVRAKTGSLSSAASLSGYVTSASGEKLVFSIMVNNFPEGIEPRTVCIDPITIILASFAGHS